MSSWTTDASANRYVKTYMKDWLDISGSYLKLRHGNMLVDGGNVGIGSTQPDSRLTIGSSSESSNQYLKIATAGNYTSGIKYLGGTANEWYTQHIDGSSQANRFAIGMDSSEYMSIINGGNLGIGTTNPQEALHVVGDVKLDLMSDFQSVGTLTIGRPTNIRQHSLTFYNSSIASSNYMAFNLHDAATSTSQSEIMRILGNGNVGIGTTNPGYELDVSGDIRGTDLLTLTRTATNNSDTQKAVETNKLLIQTSYPSGGNIAAHNDNIELTEHKMVFKRGHNQIRGGTEGNPGGNRRATTNKITVQSDKDLASIGSGPEISDNYEIDFGYAGEFLANSTEGTWAYQYRAMRFKMNDGTSLNDVMTLRHDGNVGIGSTQPSSKLDVSGTLNVTGATTLGSTLDVDGSLNVTGATTFGSTLTVTGATDLNSTLDVTGATTFGSTLNVGSFTIDSNTITTPTNSDILLQPGGATDGDEKVHIKGDLTVDGSINFTGTFIRTDTNVDVTTQLDISNSGTGPALIVTQHGNNDIMKVVDDSTVVMMIKDGGNVGIGSSQPVSELDVSGDVRVSSELIMQNGIDIVKGNNNDNINIGYEIGTINQTQNQSIAIGSYAGYNNQGLDNTYRTGNSIAIGSSAGRINQYCGAIAIGLEAGKEDQSFNTVAIGLLAGNTNQHNSAVAIGPGSGNGNQGTSAVAIGSGAGKTSQGQDCVAISRSAGFDNQGQESVAIGLNSGKTNQKTYAVAVGQAAGFTNQGQYAVAIGRLTGQNYQSTNAVAIGFQAGYDNQSANSIAIGASAGNVNQNTRSIAIGINAGKTSQNQYAVAIGNSAGLTSQNQYSVAVGTQAGETNQSSHAVALGALAGFDNQGQFSIGIGNGGGRNNQRSYAVAVGYQAGNTNQEQYAVAIGNLAGYNDQSNNSIAIGNSAGNDNQGFNSIAIGNQAGKTDQRPLSVAIGLQAGQTNQAARNIAIGEYAGQTNQKAFAVAIGGRSGQTNQGTYSIAIGAYAGQTDQSNNSIILNASGSALDSSDSNQFLVKPVREEHVHITPLGIMQYNTTGEITYNSSITTTGDDVHIAGKLDVSGNITSGGDITSTSDASVKTNVSTIDNSLDKISQLRGVYFNRNDLEDKDKIHIGLIAQEVETVFPEVINNEGSLKSVAYGNLVAPLIEAIKDLRHTVSGLEARIKELEEQP